MWSRAFAAGVLGAALFSAMSATARGAGVPMDLEWLLGSSLTGTDGAHDLGAYVLGLAMSAVLGGTFGLAYAALLRRAEGAGVLTGATIGLVHALVAGVLLAVMPVFHPAIPEAIAQPGMLMIERGHAAALLFVAGHVVFGALMGFVASSAPVAIEERS